MTEKTGNDTTTDEIGDLKGVSAVDRTVEEYDPNVGAEEGETVHTFDMLGVEIQYLDGQDDQDNAIINKNTVIEYTSPVPVYSSIECKASQLLGHASLYIESNCLKGDLFIKYNSPERLGIEEGIKLYPGLCAKLKVRNGATVVSCSVTGITLTINKNIDNRIGPVK